MNVHCDYVVLFSDCKTDESPWLCLFCGIIACGRSVLFSSIKLDPSRAELFVAISKSFESVKKSGIFVKK